MSVAAGRRVRRSSIRLAVGREYFPSRDADEDFYQRRDSIVLPKIVVNRILDGMHRIFSRIDAGAYDSDNGPDRGVYVLVAHPGCEQHADDDFQGGRLVRPPEQSPEKQATIQFLTSVQTRSRQLTADPQEGAVSYRGQFRHPAFRLYQNDPHMNHRVSLHDGDKGLGWGARHLPVNA